MRDDLNRRNGYDRAIAAVAATFLTLSATAALAQPDLVQRGTPADLAIDAAVPRPEPANVPPPTASDFKIDATSSTSPSLGSIAVNKSETTGSVPDAAKQTDEATRASDNKASETNASDNKAAETKPGDAAPAAIDSKMGAVPASEPKKDDTASAPPAATPAAAPTDTATAPAAEPTKAASNVPAADQPVADRIKEAMTTKSSKYFDRKSERALVEKFYAAREYAPLWAQSGSLNAAGKGVIARLGRADADGLNPADYPAPDFAAATTPDALADAELKLTASMLDYARQAQSGRMHWSQVSGDIQYPDHPIDAAQVLTNVSTAKDASEALQSYNPPQKLYRELRKKLAEVRGQGDGPIVKIGDGPALKYVPARKKQAEIVVEDPRVPDLRTKLGITENPTDTHYDAKVAEAVRKVQERADLRADGVLDERTIKVINSPKRDREVDTILVNMERWRWLPRDLGVPTLGDAYVILNIPDYTLKVMQHGSQVWTTRVVTGKPGIHATPLLTETMKYITVNPTWNVPPSIVYGEYLPALQQDPTVLARMGLRVDHNRDGSVHISQPPGEGNALGRIRFNFPNKFLVYQHDTPDKYLFAKEERAYSHGCMRVQNPDQYAAVLLGIELPNEHYSAERIRGMYGHSEQDIKFPTPLPVNITYQTAFVDEAGKLQIRKDVYGRDATMISMLKNGVKGRDMETVVSHSQPSYSRPKNTASASNVSYASNQPSGPSFFERLFGGGQQAPVPPRRVRRVITR